MFDFSDEEETSDGQETPKLDGHSRQRLLSLSGHGHKNKQFYDSSLQLLYNQDLTSFLLASSRGLVVKAEDS